METSLSGQVAAAKDRFKGYTDDLLKRYEERQKTRKKLGLTVVNFVGHGRCGKDTAAARFSEVTDAKYVGATSTVINPLIAWCLGLPEERSFASRHDNRAYWFDWCCEFRKQDPSLLCRMSLGQGDICVGTRSHIELEAGVAEGVLDLVVWINKVDTGIDPTMEYDAGDVLKLPRWNWIDNNKDVSHLHRAVERVAKSINMFKGE